MAVRVLGKFGEKLSEYAMSQFRERENVVVEVVYALGDAVDIPGYELPTTAGVAVQNARQIVKFINVHEIGEKIRIHEQSTSSLHRTR